MTAVAQPRGAGVAGRGEVGCVVTAVFTAGVLDRAADIIRGRGWTQHTFIDRGTGAVCVLRAVWLAVDARDGAIPSSALQRSERRLLGAVLGVDDAVVWNDEPGRTRRQVLLRLRATARRLREQDAAVGGDDKWARS